MEQVHPIICNTLKQFYLNSNVPHIIFHGNSGSGKKTILAYLMDLIYKDIHNRHPYIMYMDCYHCNGIKFIRDDLKFFAKTKINTHNGRIFKSIVLYNADKLTIDAQSALRRCIELFSESTRFFIVVEKMNGLLIPILSRFCQIYVPMCKYGNNDINLYQKLLIDIYPFYKLDKQRQLFIKHKCDDFYKINPNLITSGNVITSGNINNYVVRNLYHSEGLYSRGYSSRDLINYMKNNQPGNKINNHFIFIFNKIRLEIRSEVLLMFFIIQFMSYNMDFKNIPNM